MAIPKTPLPDLRIDKGLLRSMANPGFSKKAGAAIQASMLAPAVREKKAEEQKLIDKLIQASTDGNMSSVGSLFQQLGKNNENLNTIVQGINISRNAAANSARISMGNLFVEASDPETSSNRLTEIQGLLTNISSKNNIDPNQTNQSFLTAINNRERGIQKQAREMVSSGQSKEDFINLYGSENQNAWDLANKNQLLVDQQITNAVNTNKVDVAIDALNPILGEYAALLNELRDPTFVPSPENREKMYSLEQDIFERRQAIDLITNGNSAIQVLGMTDDAFKNQRANIRALKDQKREDDALALENDIQRATNIILSGDPAEGLRRLEEGLYSNVIRNFNPTEIQDISTRVKEAVEAKKDVIQSMGRIELSEGSIKFINDPQNKQFFAGLPEFEDNLKIVNSKTGQYSTAEKRKALLAISGAVKKARDDRRAFNLRDNVLNDRIDDAFEEFLGQGNPDSQFYNPQMITGPEYNLISNLSDENKTRVKNKMLIKLKSNYNRDAQEVLLESFRDLGIKTDPEETRRQRMLQRKIDEDYALFYRAVAADVERTIRTRGYPEFNIPPNKNITSEQFSTLLANPEVQALSSRRVLELMNPRSYNFEGVRLPSDQIAIGAGQ
tara:strand:+ start:104 stop:1948 length:1845 start_codon:yes stop_codon:yes gene_type:complete